MNTEKKKRGDRQIRKLYTRYEKIRGFAPKLTKIERIVVLNQRSVKSATSTAATYDEATGRRGRCAIVQAASRLHERAADRMGFSVIMSKNLVQGRKSGESV